MGDRVGRQALLFREEPDEENPSLHGMTLCEQLVYLHRLDFSAAGLPQKRYLAAIKLCLEDDEVYNDRVLMSALDEMSGLFLTGSEKLPLAFMRTNILVCTKHESLHSWICHVLLPRLVEGRIWSDPRQWEGWMRCAHMLEKSGDPGVSSVEAIEKLPPEQLMQYRTKWAK
jgi:Symplekin tight junction protein C terminal